MEYIINWLTAESITIIILTIIISIIGLIVAFFLILIAISALLALSYYVHARLIRKIPPDPRPEPGAADAIPPYIAEDFQVIRILPRKSKLTVISAENHTKSVTNSLDNVADLETNNQEKQP